jgi:hypothetical protein
LPPTQSGLASTVPETKSATKQAKVFVYFMEIILIRCCPNLSLRVRLGQSARLRACV